MKTLVLNCEYNYNVVFVFDEAKEEIMTYYPSLTTFLNEMCGPHFENYKVRTLCESVLMIDDKEYDAWQRLWHIIPNETPQAFEDLLTCYNSDFAYDGVEVD